MKLFLDENMPLSAVEILQGLDFVVSHVRTVGLRGAPDKDVAEAARNENALLITKDKQFGNEKLYPHQYGVLILRLPHTFSAQQLIDKLVTFLKQVDMLNIPLV
jgi:predicted nuclease of predicted toxin-antitoxin system